MIANAQLKRRLRGVVLRLVYENHEAQGHRLDDVTLTGVLERLGFDAYVNLTREILEDLAERGFATINEERDRLTGKKAIRKVQITPAGRDIIERTKVDPAVDVE